MEAFELEALELLGQRDEWPVDELPPEIDADLMRCLDQREFVEAQFDTMSNTSRYPGDTRPWAPIHSGWFSPNRQPTTAGPWEQVLARTHRDPEHRPNEVRITEMARAELARRRRTQRGTTGGGGGNAVDDLLAFLADQSNEMIAVADLPSRFANADLLTVCDADGLVEFGTRRHCYIGPANQLWIEGGWEFGSVTGPDRKPMAQILSEAMGFDRDERIRLHLRVTPQGRVHAARLKTNTEPSPNGQGQEHRDAENAPKLPNLGPHDRQAWQSSQLHGMTQVKVAEMLNEEHGTNYKQGQVSRMIRRAKQHVEASGLAAKLPQPADSERSMDPTKFEQGARQDGRAAHQRAKGRQKAKDESAD